MHDHMNVKKTNTDFASQTAYTQIINSKNLFML